jgi:hypothetical protein
MPPETITFPPNVPITLTLADPDPKAEHYDFDSQQGRFTATDGRTFTLPRSAVVKLNELGVQPGEEIGLCKYATGERGKLPTWAVWLTPKTEQARAEREKRQDITQEPPASQDNVQTPKPPVAPPIEIRKEARKKRANPDQARLFDRGTGTYGPAPQPAMIPLAANGRHRTPPARTHYAAALKQIVEVVTTTLKTSGEQWNDAAKQDLVSTLFIQAAKGGQIVFEFPEGPTA